MNILILIPARGGSKRIPQKNIRFLDGKPLIYYAIMNAKSLKNVEVYLSTNDARIKEICSIFDVDIIDRPEEIALDEKTIDDVTIFSLDLLENKLNKKYDVVITLQPTSPLLKSSSLQSALDYFLKNNIDTLISVKEERHLMWTKVNGQLIPSYSKRVNSQELEPYYVENGAFVICKAKIIRERKTRIGDSVEIYNLSEEESIDIDTNNDWAMAERILAKRNIALVVNGDHSIGMGHIYRCLTLGDKLTNHNIFYFSHSSATLGIKKLRSLNYRVLEYDNFNDLVLLLRKYEIDIVINDILNTSYAYIRKLKDNNFYVINFEDNGEGATISDLTINALYEWSGKMKNLYYGYKYECLREDIYLYPIKRSVPENIDNILIVFGGTDINNATLKILRILSNINLTDIEITIILGIGYRHEKELDSFLENNKIKDRVKIVKDVLLMSNYIYNSDLVITANGRMVFEIVSLGVPLIVFSQNEREIHHMFAHICPGIKYMGGILNASENDIKESICNMMNHYEYRKKMHENLVVYAKDIRKGINRVVNIIFELYHEKQNNWNIETIQ